MSPSNRTSPGAGVLEELRQKARLAPEGPGIYIHRDRNKDVLYVGKARNLRNRLRSYFFGIERLPHRTRQLVSRVADFEIVLAQNENESLVLESQFIKSHQPPFNIMLRDNKGYPYVRVDIRAQWPTVKMVRRRKEDGALYFGPYASGNLITGVLAVIRKFFPLVKCTPHTFKTIPRPCNYYHMRQCLAPCHLEIDPKEYGRHVDAAVALLRGQVRAVRQQLAVQMAAAAEIEDFERAATYRDQIKAIEELGQAQSVDFGVFIDAELIAVFWGTDSFAVSILSLRNGQVVGSNSYSSPYSVNVPDALSDSADPADVTESSDSSGVADVTIEEPDSSLPVDKRHRLASLLALLRLFYLSNRPASDFLIVDKTGSVRAAELASMGEFLKLATASNSTGQSDPMEYAFWDTPQDFAAAVKKPISRTERKTVAADLARLMESLFDTARQRYQQDKLLSSQSEQMLFGLQSFLGLEVEPLWIECFDISTFQGTETVASQVVFRDGKSSRKHYRRYVIRTIENQDDFGSLREVMRRRFRDAVAGENPELVLIDGGEPQVREVRKVLDGMGLAALTVVGIAKSRTRSSFVSENVEQSAERLVIPHRSAENGTLSFETRELRVGSPEYRLVTQLRDEAHRFAISFHRQRRDKRSMRSILDGIDGLGPKRKKVLLTAYPNPRLLLDHSCEEIVAQTKLNPALIAKVLQALREQEVSK
jgi:excinuclease ABC subunit C